MVDDDDDGDLGDENVCVEMMVLMAPKWGGSIGAKIMNPAEKFT